MRTLYHLFYLPIQIIPYTKNWDQHFCQHAKKLHIVRIYGMQIGSCSSLSYAIMQWRWIDSKMTIMQGSDTSMTKVQWNDQAIAMTRCSIISSLVFYRAIVIVLSRWYDSDDAMLYHVIVSSPSRYVTNALLSTIRINTSSEIKLTNGKKR